MFNGSDSIISLILKDNWKTNEVAYMNYIFADMQKFRNIKRIIWMEYRKRIIYE